MFRNTALILHGLPRLASICNAEQLYMLPLLEMGRDNISNVLHRYRPYEGPNFANQKYRKWGVSDRKLEGSYYQFYHYFGKY